MCVCVLYVCIHVCVYVYVCVCTVCMHTCVCMCVLNAFYICIVSTTNDSDIFNCPWIVQVTTRKSLFEWWWKAGCDPSLTTIGRKSSATCWRAAGITTLWRDPASPRSCRTWPSSSDQPRQNWSKLGKIVWKHQVRIDIARGSNSIVSDSILGSFSSTTNKLFILFISTEGLSSMCMSRKDKGKQLAWF